jgi:hypothetical protein
MCYQLFMFYHSAGDGIGKFIIPYEDGLNLKAEIPTILDRLLLGYWQNTYQEDMRDKTGLGPSIPQIVMLY